VRAPLLQFLRSGLKVGRRVSEKEALSKATNPQALEVNFKGIFLDEGRRISVDSAPQTKPPKMDVDLNPTCRIVVHHADFEEDRLCAPRHVHPGGSFRRRADTNP
jgi:hypothetical protein